MGMRGIRLGMIRIRVGMRGMQVITVGLMGIRGIRVGMRRIRVGMRIIEGENDGKRVRIFV